MSQIYLLSAGVATLPEPTGVKPIAALRDVCARMSATALTSAIPPGAAASAKDKRILTDHDLLAVDAGATAMRLAGLSDGSDALGCVVFTTGKGTCLAERAQQRTAYWDAEDRPDVRRFINAIEHGAEVVDPFTLLRDLDNVLIWWLCKTYGISGFNLQINQTIEPDYHALLDGISALEDGLCRTLLVGGVQVDDREEVAAVCRDQDPRRPAADLSIFLVLTIADTPPPGALARLSLSRWEGHVARSGPRSSHCEEPVGGASLSMFADLIQALPLSSASPVQLGPMGRPWGILAEAVI